MPLQVQGPEGVTNVLELEDQFVADILHSGSGVWGLGFQD